MVNQGLVRSFPIQPGCFIVLCIGIVVAALAAAKFITCSEHDGAARHEQAREKGFGIALRVIRCPARFIAIAIPIVFSVCKIVLVAMGHEIMQRESVMGRQEIDATGGFPAAKNIGRSRKPRRKIAKGALVATPEMPHVIPVAVTPFTPSRRKITELIAPKADVPRLRDMNE